MPQFTVHYNADGDAERYEDHIQCTKISPIHAARVSTDMVVRGTVTVHQTDNLE